MAASYVSFTRENLHSCDKISPLNTFYSGFKNMFNKTENFFSIIWTLFSRFLK